MVFTVWWPLDSRGQCPSKGAVIIINHHHKPCCVGVCVRASTGPCISLDAASQMLHLKSLMKAPGGSATSSPDSVGTRTTSLTGLHAKIKTRQRWKETFQHPNSLCFLAPAYWPSRSHRLWGNSGHLTPSAGRLTCGNASRRSPSRSYLPLSVATSHRLLTSCCYSPLVSMETCRCLTERVGHWPTPSTLVQEWVGTLTSMPMSTGHWTTKVK